jgi:hypothetical protein
MEETKKTKHFFDLKIPLGSLLCFYGLILTAYGLFADNALYEKSLGININFIWGIVVFLAGGLFLGFHFLKRK